LVESQNRFLCIHGHFYQPPRENPWIEAVEAEKSAAPYHDWNDRITDECYAVNLAARILDGSNQITSIVNNYSRLSFDFGPTLQAWLEANHPEVYTAIADSDRENASDYSGHGSAIAQAYNHIIMPLANRRDKETQVIWAISDFRRRFERLPEGMWLPETAVDLETLDIMSEQGIKFTILAPHQASRFKTQGGPWQNATGSFDSSVPYLCRLPSGRSIAIFFYHTELSRGVAFQGLLDNGDILADRILSAFGNNSTPSLITIATDGETYGHHRRFGDMALAYAFDKLVRLGVKITNLAEYLEMHPPKMEVEIIQNSAWSCDHGVERWQSGCCCSTGAHPGWNQKWRAPLHQAMDLLRDRFSPEFEKEAALLFSDPWAARNAYQSVIADRTPGNIEAFLKLHAKKALSDSEKIRALKLMELQRHLMAIYTSCGWFFDDIGGLESILVLKQAGRALQLGRQLFDESPERDFLEILENAQSNDRSLGNGWDIFEREVRPLISDIKQAGANFAMKSLFQEPDPVSELYTFSVRVKDLKKFGAGKLRVSSGDIEISSKVTSETAHFVFAATLWGEHNLACGVRPFRSPDDYVKLQEQLKSIGDGVDCAGCLKFLNNEFPGPGFDLHSLFGDERTKIIDNIVGRALSDAEAAHREIYLRHHDTMLFLYSLGQSAPPQFTASAAFVLNTDLRKALQNDVPDLEAIENLVAESKMWGISPDKESISYYLSGQLENLVQALFNNPDDAAAMTQATGLLQLLKEIMSFPNLWRVQNLYFALAQSIYFDRQEQSGYQIWSESFRELGALLSVRID